MVLALGQNNFLDGFGWVQLDKAMEAGNCTIPVTIVTGAQSEGESEGKGEEQWGWKDPRCTEHKILCVTFNFNNNHERSCQRQELKCGVTTVTKWPGVAQPLCAPC